ncbi:cadherin-related family member 1 isoform X1 [Leucoraja erinacea]|uniref:cadherin-related family member 1 isoform X1 n=2 Tax=Leucoraja erinaceus TaxID=7782 RepID=UPI002458CA3B|nr:cadherin-related family member 1 isoform X1 [Leucoraja erinacea]
MLNFPLVHADYAPYFYDNAPNSTNGNMAMLSIPEDTLIGSHVYTLNGTDLEGNSVAYDMTFEPGSKNYFSVDPQTGKVTLVEELDREKEDEIEVLVSISDGINKVVETVRILVTDANDESPEFIKTPYIINVPENTPPGASIFKVYAVDKDNGSGGSVTYFLQNMRKSKFTIDRYSGVIQIKPSATLDFEKSRVHFVTVITKDGGGKHRGRHQICSSTATVTINVEDVQDTPPVFTGIPYFGYVYEDTELGSEILSVVAHDGDRGNPNPIRYSIAHGNDGSFEINNTSGVITLLQSTEHLQKDVYKLLVQASEVSPEVDMLAFMTAMVTIQVVDLNNHQPTFYGEHGPQSQFEITMPEHPPEGEILRGLKITVKDYDQGPNSQFILTLVGAGGRFRVIPQTVLSEAQVTLIVENSTAIDYEKSQMLTFQLVAAESDTPEQFSSTADIIVHIVDTNDNTPEFTSAFYLARIPENSPGGSPVICVSANDPDSEMWGEVKYSIHGAGADLFLIHPSTGVIYTQPWAELDAEEQSKYNFHIKADDVEGKHSLAEVFVTVLDVNDHYPEFTENVLDKVMIIGSPVKVEAKDEDAEEPNNIVDYSIMQGDPANVFDIDQATGEIMLKSYIRSLEVIHNITKTRGGHWSLVVQAKDRGSPSFSTTAVVRIDITEETAGNGHLADFLLQSKDNPMQVVGVIAGIIGFFVVLTVMISSVMFWRNKKSNRIGPVRRIIKRRSGWKLQARRSKWFQSKKSTQTRGNFMTSTDDPHLQTVSGLNNRPALQLALPRAPMLPPPISTHPTRLHKPKRDIPSVSGTISPKRSFVPQQSKGKTGSNINNALVSELKMRLERKMNEDASRLYL